MSQKQTLLEMTQEILTSMQSDIVDSIDDTGESRAVASIIRRAYWDNFGPMDLPEHYTFFQLDETSASTPTLMTVPDNVMAISWIKYNLENPEDTDDNFEDIPYLDLKEFIRRSDGLRVSADNVGSFSVDISPINTDATTFYYTTSSPPRNYTTPDEDNILFDAIDTDTESFLRAAKTKCYGLIDPTFSLTDEFVPDLKPLQFAWLLNAAKNLAFAELKQTQHGIAAATARALKVSSQRTKFTTSKPNPLDTFPDFGRKRRR